MATSPSDMASDHDPGQASIRHQVERLPPMMDHTHTQVWLAGASIVRLTSHIITAHEEEVPAGRWTREQLLSIHRDMHEERSMGEDETGLKELYKDRAETEGLDEDLDEEPESMPIPPSVDSCFLNSAAAIELAEEALNERSATCEERSQAWLNIAHSWRNLGEVMQ